MRHSETGCSRRPGRVCGRNTGQNVKRITVLHDEKYGDFLYVESIVGFVAVEAEFPAACQTNPVGSGTFSAALAGVGIEDPCLLRQLNRCFLHVEHILRLAALIVSEGFLTGHTQGLGLQHQTDGLVMLAVVEGECLLTPHMEQKVSLTHTAAQQNLNGIHTAGIIFGNADHLLVIREFQFQ